MPVIPLPSERVFNSATFMCTHIVLTTIINLSNLHLKNPKKLIFYLFSALCMPVIIFQSERVFNSASFMCGHIVLNTIRNFSNLHLKNLAKICRNHARNPLRCAYAAALAWPEMAPTFLIGQTLNNVSALSTALTQACVVTEM